TMPADYPGFMKELKTRIRQERTKAVLAANSALVLMYWDIGNSILAKQRKSGWGTKVIDRMSADLKEEFPDMSGFSPRNLKYMRKFAEAWPVGRVEYKKREKGESNRRERKGNSVHEWHEWKWVFKINAGKGNLTTDELG
ncbi:MAG: DUF1016 N-terminal domain-containing protein, partial [Victivallaceae bacterium]|nr:DUF1016 N-terminal domain-containing protein [Victivallaceae bacterium]